MLTLAAQLGLLRPNNTGLLLGPQRRTKNPYSLPQETPLQTPGSRHPCAPIPAASVTSFVQAEGLGSRERSRLWQEEERE